MAYDPRSSFGQAPGVVPAYVQKQKTIQVYRILTGLILVVALGASVAVFMYRNYAKEELALAKTALEDTSKESDEVKKYVADLQEYDRKITTAKRLLDAHVAPSLIFEEIEKSTKETVAFTKFDYAYEPGFDVTVELAGNTKELDSVFLQKKQLSHDKLFSEFLLQNITILDEFSISEDGELSIPSAEDAEAPTGVDFSVEGIFDKKLIQFKGDLLAGIDVAEDTQATSTEDITGATGSTTDAGVSTSTSAQSNEETP